MQTIKMFESETSGEFSSAILKVLLILLLLPSSIPVQEECYGNKYKETSSHIFSWADFNIDPCTNFEDFACGNFKRVNPWPPIAIAFWDSFRWKMFSNTLHFHQLLASNSKMVAGQPSTAVSKMQRYYASCLASSKRNVTILFEVLRKIGGWPLASEAFKDHPMHRWLEWDNENTEALFQSLSYQSYPFFLIKRTGDKNIEMYKPPFTFQDPAKYDQHHNYLEFVTQTLNLMFRGRKRDDFSLQLNIMKMMQLERELLMNAWNASGTSHAVSNVGDFNLLLGEQIGFSALLNRHTNADFKDEVRFYYEDVDYFNKLQATLRKYNSETIGDYIAWSLVRTLSTSQSKLTQFNSPESLEYEENKATRPEMYVDMFFYAKTPKWKLCVEDTVEKFKFAMAPLFIQEQFDLRHEDLIKYIFSELRTTAEGSFPVFFDVQTREKMVTKLEKTRFLLGYPSFVLNARLLDKRYEEYEVGADYLENSVKHRFATTKFERDNGYQNLDFSPVREHIQFERDENMVQFSVTTLQPPIFFPDAPTEVNFGSLGFLIGHELSHGFVPPGTDYNENGEAENWLTSESEGKFEFRAGCFKRKYSNYTIFNKHIDGAASNNENMVDAAGIWLAYHALLRSYGGDEAGSEELAKRTELAGFNVTRAQLFFISYAQFWCSQYDERESARFFSDAHGFNSLRMTGTLSNSEEFATAFQCVEHNAWNSASMCPIFKKPGSY